MQNSLTDDSLPLDFLYELEDGQSLLYTQARLLLNRLGQALSSNAQLCQSLASSLLGSQQEAWLAEQLAELGRVVAMDAGQAASWSGTAGLQLSGARLLGHLSHFCGGPEPEALLRCLRTAIGSSAEEERQRRLKIWTACLRFAESDGAYSQLKKEVQGAQCFYPRESRLIQRALVLLDTFL